MNTSDSFGIFHPLVPDTVLPNDWYAGRIPANIKAGTGSVLDSSFCFKHFYAQGEIGLRVGCNCTIWRTAISVEPQGQIEIGDDCYLANAALTCAARITLGSRVLVAGGATIADSDFHPIAPLARLADTVAISPVGNRGERPSIEADPVVIEDDVWIGYNATVLKGVRIGAGAVVEAGAVVTKSVPARVRVAGNPARIVSEVLP